MNSNVVLLEGFFKKLIILSHHYNEKHCNISKGNKRFMHS